MKRKWLMGLAGTMLITGLVGCGSESDGDASDNKSVTLRMLAWGNGPAELEGDKEILDVFEEENPGIKVELIHVPYDNVNEKFVTMSAGGDQPDVTWVRDTALQSFASQNLLMELDELLAEAGLSEDEWLPGAWEMGRYEDNVYALPRDLITHHIVYNKDMFDEAGVDYPEEGWTWDDFLEKAKDLTVEENGKITQFGTSGYYWMEALLQNGGEVFSMDGTEVLIDTPESVEAISWIRDLSNLHKVSPTATESEGLGDLFLAGRAAMGIAGPWHWRAYAEDGNFEWDIQEMPGGKEGNKSQLLGLPVAIGSQTEHPEEAWKLLEFLTHGKGQEIQADIVGAYPSVISAADTFGTSHYAPDNIAIVAKAMEENTVVQSFFPEKSEALTNVQPVIDQINNKDLDVEDELKKLGDKLRTEYNKK